MNNRPDLESRLRAYLTSGARTQAPSGMEGRIAARVLGRRYSWAFQLMAAAAVLVLAIGLGVGVTKLRQSNAALKVSPRPTPIVTATASVSPPATPPASPTPEPSVGPYPLMAPTTFTMVSMSTGWAAGSGTNRILRTSDGGTHWNDLTPSGARPGNWTPFFFDADSAWLASSVQPGSSTADFSVAIYRTVNGGRSWQQAGTVAAAEGWPAALDFVDKNHGWLFMKLGGAAGSDGVAFYGTMDGGATWAKLSEANTSGASGRLPLRCSKGTPVFLNSSTGWMPGGCSAGGGPFFYVTRDGGRTWNDARIAMPASAAAPCMCEIDSLRFSDSRNGAFVLNIYEGSGLPQNVLYTTSDAGASWRPGPPLPANSYTVFLLDAMQGWTVDAKANNLLFTADAGRHWSVVGTIPSTQVVMVYQFVTDKIGWALGSEAKGQSVLKTVDGGATWTSQLAPAR